mgnify:CR=1 FL=1
MGPCLPGLSSAPDIWHARAEVPNARASVEHKASVRSVGRESGSGFGSEGGLRAADDGVGQGAEAWGWAVWVRGLVMLILGLVRPCLPAAGAGTGGWRCQDPRRGGRERAHSAFGLSGGTSKQERLSTSALGLGPGPGGDKLDRKTVRPINLRVLSQRAFGDGPALDLEPGLNWTIDLDGYEKP